MAAATRQPTFVTWAEFASSNPDLAAFGAARLTALPAYLATVRADGSPRVHPITPVLAPSGLYVFMEPTSPKGVDLREARTLRAALRCARHGRERR